MRGFVLALMLVASGLHAAASDDLILTGGKVFTAVRGAPFAAAIAVKDGRITAVGTTREVQSHAGVDALRIDLGGRVVVPGFDDAHVHFAPDSAGTKLEFDSLEPSWDDVQAALTKAVAATRPGTLIVGQVGRRVVLDESVTRDALDRLAPNHAVLLNAFYGHGLVLNSRAMILLGIADEAVDPMGGYYERSFDSRRLNGRVWEYPQWAIARALTARVSDREATAALQALAKDAIGYGITSLQIFPGMPMERFVSLVRAADLPIRIRAMALPTTTVAGRDRSDVTALAKVAPSERLVASGIKWILDGTPIEHGAAMRAPYFDRQDTSGRLNFPEPEIGRMVDDSLIVDQPLLLHCVGDRTADVVLGMLEARSDVNWREKRLRFEHGDGVGGDLIARAAKLGIVIVQNPSHFARELVGDRFAPDAPVQQLRSLLEAGVPIALGSDGPLNPFLNIMLATVHPMRPQEALTREQAVIAYTAGSAYAAFAEKERGTLEVGKVADLTVLSGDLFSMPTEALPTLRSEMTIVGGKVVYEAHQGPGPS